MTEKAGAGQAGNPKSTDSAADEKAASDKVGRERNAEIAKQNDPKQSGDPSWAKRGEGAGAESAAERVASSADPTSGTSDEVLDPFPAYEAKSLDELRALAKSRDVTVGRDVEKAFLVHALRAKDGSTEYDLMRLDDLRSKAKERDVGVPPEAEVAHLVTELRADDTATR